MKSWRLAKSLEVLRQQVNAAYPMRGKLNDGGIGNAAHAKLGDKSDHNPHVYDPTKIARGVVTAFDITHDPSHGCDAGKLAETIIASRDVRVKYIIFAGRIVRSYAKPGIAPWTWAPYHGASKHEHHVHISVLPDPALFDSVAAWRIS